MGHQVVGHSNPSDPLAVKQIVDNSLGHFPRDSVWATSTFRGFTFVYSHTHTCSARSVLSGQNTLGYPVQAKIAHRGNLAEIKNYSESLNFLQQKPLKYTLIGDIEK